MRIKQIPKQFQLGPHVYIVKQEEGLSARDGLLGQHITNQRLIRLQPFDKSLNSPISEYLQTYYHEKVHAILAVMCEDELCKNEKFVDLFATFLLQTDQTSKYK